MAETDWAQAFGGTTVGLPGTQGGTIARDEVSPSGARLTLEVTSGPVAVTCGVEGWLLHVRLFGGEEEAQAAFEEMKPALAELAESLPASGPRSLDAASLKEAHQRMLRFTSRFP